MPKPITVQQFFAQFPNDDACLEHLFHTRFGPEFACPRCGEIGKFRRLTKLPAYTCNCGHHVHPMAGTPFERSRTSLQKWFYAMFLFTTTRHGVSAKELERQLGVTYKTAWRMAHQIRDYMGWVDGDAPLGGSGSRGIVEADKAFIGGKDKMGQSDKTVVLGMLERGLSGAILTRVIPDKSGRSVLPMIRKWVREGSRVATDEGRGFMDLASWGYLHSTVNHKAKEYARGETHTNTLETFWLWLKKGIAGTHVHVSRKHLHRYLGEFEFRFNLRKSPALMFPLLMTAFPRP